MKTNTNTVSVIPTTANNGALGMEFYFADKPDSEVTAKLKALKAHFSAKGTKGPRWYCVDSAIPAVAQALETEGFKLACKKSDKPEVDKRLAISQTAVKTTAKTAAKTTAKTTTKTTAKTTAKTAEQSLEERLAVLENSVSKLTSLLEQML